MRGLVSKGQGRSCRSARASAQKAGSAATRGSAVVAGERERLSLMSETRVTFGPWRPFLCASRRWLLKQEVGLLCVDRGFSRRCVEPCSAEEEAGLGTSGLGRGQRSTPFALEHLSVARTMIFSASCWSLRRVPTHGRLMPCGNWPLA
jgi:hypothetical protein